MPLLTEDFVERLKTARKKKRLSQRKLGARFGVPQSHISKIESGNVDLRLSTLVEYARILDLELFLVPSASVLAVETMIRVTESNRNVDELTLPAYRLDDDDIEGDTDD
ncbi:MAG TPA: helix-turn-helix transcriptional regulator [Orrella sp.]